MPSVWETILQLPILPRDGRKVRGHHAWTGGGILTEADVSDGWEELVT
jgi:hypothetical protein